MWWRVDFINGNWTQVPEYKIADYFYKNYLNIKSVRKL